MGVSHDKDEDKGNPGGPVGIGIGIGIVLGAIIGLVMDNLATGIALGVAFGAAVGSMGYFSNQLNFYMEWSSGSGLEFMCDERYGLEILKFEVFKLFLLVLPWISV